MKLTLTPEVQQFIDDQVKGGRFDSPSDVIIEAMQRMMIESELELDDETAAAINRAEAQFNRGEGIDFKEFAANMRKRISSRG